LRKNPEGHDWYTGDYFSTRYGLPETLWVRIGHIFDPPPPLAEGRFMSRLRVSRSRCTWMISKSLDVVLSI